MRALPLLIALSTLAGCGGLWKTASKGFRPSDYGVEASKRVVEYGQPVPRGGGRQILGQPYAVHGRWYYPADVTHYSQTGTASWYGRDFHGRYTANGEIYDMDALSAAHPTLPLPSYARVTNLANGRSVVVRVNDRGPYVGDRLIDLSARTAEVLDFTSEGTASVRVDYIGLAPLDGRDEAQLAASYRAPGTRPGPDASFRTVKGPPQASNVVVASAPTPRPGKPDPLATLLASSTTSTPAGRGAVLSTSSMTLRGGQTLGDKTGSIRR